MLLGDGMHSAVRRLVRRALWARLTPPSAPLRAPVVAGVATQGHLNTAAAR